MNEYMHACMHVVKYTKNRSRGFTTGSRLTRGSTTVHHAMSTKRARDTLNNPYRYPTLPPLTSWSIRDTVLNEIGVTISMHVLPCVHVSQSVSSLITALMNSLAFPCCSSLWPVCVRCTYLLNCQI